MKPNRESIDLLPNKVSIYLGLLIKLERVILTLSLKESPLLNLHSLFISTFVTSILNRQLIMKNQITTIIVLILLLSGASAIAQYDTRYDKDIGFRIGPSYYLGDLSGTKATNSFGPMNIQFGQVGLHVGFTGRKFFSSILAVEASINYGRIRGTDKLSKNPTHYTRNLSFRNDIFEGSVRAEGHFLKLRDVGRTYRYNLSMNVFAFIGVGLFYHNPKAKLDGTWHSLQPLQTEGKSYSKIQPSIPLGLGFEFRINKRHLIGWDVGVRKTFTDYIDDVSSNYLHHSNFDSDPTAKALQDRSVELEGTGDPLYIGSEYYSYGTNTEEAGIRGNPKNDDWYIWSGITYKYSIKGKRSSFNRKKYHFARRKVKRRRSRARF